MTSDDTRYLLICNVADGLVGQINGVVVQLQLARRMGLQPIVYLHERSFLFGRRNPYYDDKQGPNVWDYYFEPIGASPEELPSLVNSGKVYTLATLAELFRLYRWEPRSSFMNPYGYYRSVKNHADGSYPSNWWRSQREKARVFFEDGTVRFKTFIIDQVETFAREHFSEETLGLQLRGSDKYDFGVGPNLSNKILPEMYFSHINKYLEEHPKCIRIFVATDQRQWLDVLKKAYPEKILSFSKMSLSESNENCFHNAHDKAMRGVEPLVDLLLLSRCSRIIKCHASVGEMALTLNPKIDFVDLNYVDQPFEAKSRPFRAVFAPAIRLMCSIWGMLAENGMALTKVASVEKDCIVVKSSAPRVLDAMEGADRMPPLLSRQFISEAFRWSLQRLGDQCFAYEARRFDR